jgi:hypothetical protein
MMPFSALLAIILTTTPAIVFADVVSVVVSSFEFAAVLARRVAMAAIIITFIIVFLVSMSTLFMTVTIVIAIVVIGFVVVSSLALSPPIALVTIAIEPFPVTTALKAMFQKRR